MTEQVRVLGGDYGTMADANGQFANTIEALNCSDTILLETIDLKKTMFALKQITRRE